MTRRSAPALSAVLAAIFCISLLAGCGSSQKQTTGTSASTTTPGSAATPDTITIDNFAFSPATLRVKPGARVAVHNVDTATHTLTAAPHAGAFNTGDVSPGTTKYFTAPKTSGRYPYICMIHQFMHGTLIVS